MVRACAGRDSGIAGEGGGQNEAEAWVGGR